MAKKGEIASALVFALASGMTNETEAVHKAYSRDALDLARCIVAEAGWTPGNDAAAILHVLERRSQLPAWRDARGNAADVARAYCVSLSGRSQSERAARMRVLKREQIPTRVMRLTEGWVEGRRPRDPCGGAAMHWGAAGNPEQCTLPVVSCGATQNIFYSGPN